jgi:hypothetical protein
MTMNTTIIHENKPIAAMTGGDAAKAEAQVPAAVNDFSDASNALLIIHLRGDYQIYALQKAALAIRSTTGDGTAALESAMATVKDRIEAVLAEIEWRLVA